MTESPSGGVLPFSREEMVAKFAATPQSTALWNLIGRTHDEYSGIGIEELFAQLEEAISKTGGSFYPDQKPKSLDEEECSYLFKMKSHLVVLGGIYTVRSTVPNELRTGYENAQDTPTYNAARLEFLDAVYEWGETHREENTPIPIDQEIADELNGLYDSYESLVRFYGEKRPYEDHSLRHAIVSNYEHIFNPHFPIKEIAIL